MYETLIVDGVDLATVVTCITALDGLYTPALTRGDNVVVPGVDGEDHVDKPFGTSVAEFGLVLAGSTTAEFNDGLRALRTLIQPGKKLGLERHLSYTTGNEAHVANGELSSGLAPTLSLMRFGRVTMSLKILDGLWYATSAITVAYGSSTTIDVVGEARTHRMQIALAPGDSITNETTGHVLNTDISTGGTIAVDVETMTAIQDGNDVSNALGFNRLMPFRLVPGNNLITSVSGAGGLITYTPAYQ